MPQERSGYNNLRIEVYSPYSLTPILDTGEDLPRAQGLTLDTVYPGGVFGPCSFLLPRDVFKSWPFRQGQRLVIRNGLAVCWEGQVVNPGLYADEQGMGRVVNGAGYWGQLLGVQGWRKPWADVRVDAGTWVQQNVSAYKLATLSRQSELNIVPKQNRWNAGQYFAVRYTAPTGETIKRIKYSYDFSKTASVAPSLVIYFQVAGPTYTNETTLYDGNLTVGATIAAWITTDYMYIGMNAGDTDQLQPGDTVVLHVTMGATKNAVVSGINQQYWNGAAWTAVAGGGDGTSVGGKTLAQTGDITFTKPGDWAATALGDANKSSKMWVRWFVGTNLTANITPAEISFGMTQDWYAVVYNVGLAAEIAATKISATGTGTIDNTLATPSQAVELRLVSNVQQTPWANGTVYGEFSGVTVYTVTDNPVTPTTIIKDWRGHISNLNADTSQIATAASPLTIEPWLTGVSLDYELASANIARLAGFGDAAFNPWAAYVLESDSAQTPAGTPVLAFQQYLALTDYDYSVRLDDPTLKSLGLNETDVWNWIVVSYVDLNGVTNWVTPDDDATLTDATSSAAYGRREKILTGRFTTLAAATNYGRRFLASNKDKHYYVSRPIPIVGYITGKNGNPAPASLIRAGKRIQVANILSDEVGVTGAGLTFTISGTHYDDASETCQVSCSVPDNAAVIIARLMQGLL